MKNKFIIALAIGFVILGLYSCKKNNPEPTKDDTPAKVNSYIRFNHWVDGVDVVYDTVKYTNEFGNNFSIETIQYFISRVTLVKENGDEIVIKDAIYVDAKKPELLFKKITKSIPNGIYTGIKFVFGLDAAMNQSGAFPNFPETAMEWPTMMGGGYHYMKLEGRYAVGTGYNFFNFHTGPLNGAENYFSVSLPMNLKVTKNEFDISLNMEIQNWFRNPHTFDLTTIAGGMMGNQAKQQLVKENGVDVFSVSE